MRKLGYTKRQFPGPYPPSHSLEGKEGHLPPDGMLQPEAEDELRCGTRWLKDHMIGCSYPVGHDFGPYTDHLGEGLFPSFTLDFENQIPISAGGVHPHTGLLLFALALNLRPDVIIETGTFYGYSTMFLAKACELWRQGTVFTFDPEDKLIAPEVKAHPHVRCIKRRSVEVLEAFCQEVGQVDMAFLDSWKRLGIWEMRTIDPYVPEGGIVVFHDTQHLSDGRTLFEMLERNALDYQRILFAGTPRDDNPHAYYGNADGRGLYVLRKTNRDPWLNVADAESGLFGEHQVVPETIYRPCMLSSPPRGTLALAVSMYDEHVNMGENLARVGSQCSHVVVAQSDLTPEPSMVAALAQHPSGHYMQFPNLYPPEGSATGERFDYGTCSVLRNFGAAFTRLHELGPVDYIIGMYGDTALYHLEGIRQLLVDMGDADLAVSRAMGQAFHRADLTWDEMADPSHPKGGRVQDESNGDFMPHLFILRGKHVSRFCEIPMTNRWCAEQCFSDAAGDLTRYVFSTTAYGFNDGIGYNLPSPGNWKH